MIKKFFILFFLIILNNKSYAKEDLMILKLEYGEVVIELFNEIAPKTVERIKKLASEKNQNIGILL